MNENNSYNNNKNAKYKYEKIKIKDTNFYKHTLNYSNSISNITKQIDTRLRDITIENDTLNNFSPDKPKKLSTLVRTRIRGVSKNLTRTRQKPKTLNAYEKTNQHFGFKKSVSGNMIFRDFATDNGSPPKIHLNLHYEKFQKAINNIEINEINNSELRFEPIEDTNPTIDIDVKDKVDLSAHKHYHKGIKRAFLRKAEEEEEKKKRNFSPLLHLVDTNFNNIEKFSYKQDKSQFHTNGPSRPYSSIPTEGKKVKKYVPHPVYKKINSALKKSIKIKNDLLSKSGSYSYYTSFKAINDSKQFSLNAKCNNKSMDNINILVPLEKIPKKFFIYKYGYFISTNPKYKDFLLRCRFISNITPTNSYKFRKEIGDQVLQMKVRKENIDKITFIPIEDERYKTPNNVKDENTHLNYEAIIKQAEKNKKQLSKISF